MPTETLNKCHDILKPGGFLAVSSWQNIAFLKVFARALATLPNAPYCPTEADIQRTLYSGRPWSSPDYVAQTLKEAGFVDVEVKVEPNVADSGTPDQFMELAQMMLQQFSGFWPEAEREESMKRASEALLKQVTEEAGGMDKHVYLTFNGIVGTGRKPT